MWTTLTITSFHNKHNNYVIIYLWKNIMCRTTPKTRVTLNNGCCFVSFSPTLLRRSWLVGVTACRAAWSHLCTFVRVCVWLRRRKRLPAQPPPSPHHTLCCKHNHMSTLAHTHAPASMYVWLRFPKRFKLFFVLFCFVGSVCWSSSAC